MSADAQAAVDAFFDHDAPNWQSIYGRADLFSVVHQLRQRIALDWIRRLGLPRGSAVLEVGCGAGLQAIAMARQGLDVTAGDSTAAMLELARTNADRSGVRLTLKRLDAHHLDAETGTFDLVVALGVIPWLHSPEVGLGEMARVLRQGGHVIVNADNSARLASWIDPLYSPAVAPARRVARWFVSRGGDSRRGAMPSTIRHSKRQFDAFLSRAGLSKVQGETFGFGPFTLLGRRAFGERMSVRMHERLQALADRGAPLLRSCGAQYIVLGRKGMV